MNVIIVDDEMLAIKKMQAIIQEQQSIYSNLNIIGSFLDPYEAINLASNQRIDLAFLDIEMPEINGFELAERLLNKHPKMRIVFVTAYHDYAIKAFELNALDYLLKPVSRQRFSLTLQRIINDVPVYQKKLEQKKAMICCFRRLHYKDDEGIECNFPWKTLKAAELFSYLIYRRNESVNKQVLFDLLWPAYDDAKATAQLHTAIYQIRTIIKSIELDLEIRYQDEGYRLVWGEVELDVEQWETRVRNAPKLEHNSLADHLEILDLFKGDFLSEQRYLWAEVEQERLRYIWLEHILAIAECYISQEQYTEAILLYRSVRDYQPYMEDGYFQLMKLFDRLNRPAEVIKQYDLLSTTLLEELGMPPSDEVMRWFTNWNASNMNRLAE